MKDLILEALTTVVKVAGPVVAKFATTLVAKLPTIIETAIKVVKVVGLIIKDVAEVMDILHPNDNIEELGKKTMQEGTRPKMEDESTKDYIEYLRNEIKLDEERWKNMTPEEELQANVLGTSMVTTAISEECDVELSPDFMMTINVLGMSSKQLSEYIKSFSENGIDSLDALTDYLRGELSGDTKNEIHVIVKETEGKLHPDLSNGEILQEIDAMKEKMAESNNNPVE